MKKILCMLVLIVLVFPVLTTAYGEQETETEESLVVPLGPEEDKEFVEKNIRMYPISLETEICETYVMHFRKKEALPFEVDGVYNIESFERAKRKFYYFEEPNDFYEVMTYDERPGFAFVIHHTGEKGFSYAHVCRGTGAFYGLTPNCILFKEETGIIAVHFKEKHKPGDKEYPESRFEDLTKWERERTIYPKGWYKE